VACRDKYTFIDKSESKSMYWNSCREHRHTEAGKEKVSKANVAKLVIQVQIIDS